MIFPIGDLPGRRILFTDDFGAPRGDHTHTGNDIFANDPVTLKNLAGSPLVAVVGGLVKKDPNELGGNALYLKGADGTGWYYAHLDRYVGSFPRDVVAGDVIGYVGNTGSASKGDPHLHFEKHPAGGAAVDPYLDLKAATHITAGPVEGIAWGRVAATGLAAGVVIGAFWFGLKRLGKIH